MFDWTNKFCGLFPTSTSFRASGLMTAAFVFLICLLAAAQSAQAQFTFTVTRTDDRNTTCVSGTDCSLREAVNAANALVTNDTINFSIPAGNPNCTAGVCTITLTSELVVNSAATAGAFLITNSTGAANLLISGNNSSRVFSLNSGANLTINGITITKGNGIGANGTLAGGGIYNAASGILILTNSIVSNSSAFGGGGGIANLGTLTVTNTTISGNSMTNCLNCRGGGILNQGTSIVTGSTISGNSNTGDGYGGGGISNLGTLTMTNSTVSGNTARGNGGGIENLGSGTLTSVTITNNHAFVNNNVDPTSSGGGIGDERCNGAGCPGPLLLRNTIVADNYRGAGTTTKNDIVGVVDAASSYNLIGTGGLSNGTNNNQVGVANPGLGSLANNGGLTQTHALVFGSPAIDKGNSFTLTTDQRGLSRPVDLNDTMYPDTSDASDIGAYEAQTAPTAPTAATVSVSGRVTTASGRGIQNVRLSLTDANGQIRTAQTTSFGYYHFDDVRAGETYILAANGKHYLFSESVQVLNISEETNEVNFIADSEKKLRSF